VVDWEVQVGGHVGLSRTELCDHAGKAWLQHGEGMVARRRVPPRGRLQEDRFTTARTAGACNFVGRPANGYSGGGPIELVTGPRASSSSGDWDATAVTDDRSSAHALAKRGEDL
jgi:hypothetical protein